MKHYRWKPEGATEVTRDGINAVVYLSDKGPRPVAIGYRGKAAKHSFNYSFRDEARRAEYVEQFFANVKARQETVAARRGERKAFQTKLKVGDILYGSWGYDQTNVDFYEVVAVPGPQTVDLRELKQTRREIGSGGDKVKPATGPDRFVGETVYRKRVAPGFSGGDYVNSPAYGGLWKFEGEEKYATSFGWGH